jgi:CheY-like chemotaxis protein
MTDDRPVPYKIPCILIVDDTPANLDLLAEVMRNHGYEPRPTPNGKLALMSAQAEPPDLILLDINMPGMDGFEVCERLKANAATRHVPIIFITAFDDPDDKVRGFELGAADYITKPFHIEEVRARVDTHLKIRQLQYRLQQQNEHLEQQVAERTRQLSQANEKLQKLRRLSDDFLHMISYEIRTPANGVLGIGELLISLCPETDESTRYIELFRESGARLTQLMQNADLIGEIDKVQQAAGEKVAFATLFADLRAALEDVRVSLDPPIGLETVQLYGSPVLLKRALEIMVRLAVVFSRLKRTVRLRGEVSGAHLRLSCELDSLRIPAASAAGFFVLESNVRAETEAETMGLAPVAAQKILSAFGGDIRLAKGAGDAGQLEALLPLAPAAN